MKALTKNQLNRLPDYLAVLKRMKKDNKEIVSCEEIAKTLNLNNEQVRKDIASISSINGIPNKGRNVNQLIKDIEDILGYHEGNNAVLIGVGNLGKALMKYDKFSDYGLKIVAAFDISRLVIGLDINNIHIYDMYMLEDIIKENNVKIGIITVPSDKAQEIADRLIRDNIEGIWNFAPTLLDVPSNVIVSNMNMAQSLGALSHKLYIKNKENLKNG